MSSPGTYEYNLVKQMNMTRSSDDRDFTHPLLEETTSQNPLRRIVTSELQWADFINGCYNDPDYGKDTTITEDVVTEEEASTATDPVDDTAETTIDDSFTNTDGERRRLQIEASNEPEEADADEGDQSLEDELTEDGEGTVARTDEVEPLVIVIKPDNNVPEGQLVCDLFYEKDWEMRRRYTYSCNEATIKTLPCTGTFACLCRHSDKEFYRVSKTMAVVPENFTGLTTGLSDIWIDKVVVDDSDDDEDTDLQLIIIIVSSVVGFIFLCCIFYCCCVCFINRSHKVNYVTDISGDKGKKASPVSKPKRGDVAPDPMVSITVAEVEMQQSHLDGNASHERVHSEMVLSADPSQADVNSAIDANVPDSRS